MTIPLVRRNRISASLITGLALTALVAAAPATAFARDHHGHRGQGHHRHHHYHWGADRGAHYRYHRGERIGYNDWRDAPVVDYRAHHLRRPERGYEWREHNGQYVLAAVATSLIASVLLNHH